MRKCLQCEKDFEPKKPKAKFCSATCRVNHFRGEKKRFKELMKQDKPLEEILAFAFGEAEAKVVLSKIESQFDLKSAKVIKETGKAVAKFVFEDVDVKKDINSAYDNQRERMMSTLKEASDKSAVQPKGLHEKSNATKISELEAQIKTLGNSSAATLVKKGLLKQIRSLKK